MVTEGGTPRWNPARVEEQLHGAAGFGIGYALRFPRLVKFREADKRAEDATTVDEVKKLYKNQFKRQ